jgi:hypothetical protein
MISLLFAVLEIRFPLFRRFAVHGLVDSGGSNGKGEVFQIQEVFSTSFPQ